jgi:hypothetical protein
MCFVSHGVTWMLNFWCSLLKVVMLLKIRMFKRDMSPLRFCMCKVSTRMKFSVNGLSIWSTCCIQNASQLFLVKRLLQLIHWHRGKGDLCGHGKW